MLSEREVMDKLHEYAEQFKLAYCNKEWAKAKLLYFRVQTVATFLELLEKDLAVFFGNRPYKEDWEELNPGRFPEKKQEVAPVQPQNGQEKRKTSKVIKAKNPEKPKKIQEEQEREALAVEKMVKNSKP